MGCMNRFEAEVYHSRHYHVHVWAEILSMIANREVGGDRSRVRLDHLCLLFVHHALALL